ncbi:MAG: histidine kinase [Dehalococcoidales bacterium]|nr:histidine kinase [Dehalococcoidales bacterium]
MKTIIGLFRRIKGSLYRTIRRRMLFWSISFFIVAVSLLSVSIFWLGQTEIVNQTRERNVQMASVISRDINAQISGIYADARNFSRYLEGIDSGLEAQAEAVLALRLSSSQRYRSVYYFDANGAILFQLADSPQSLLLVKDGLEIVSRPAVSPDKDVVAAFAASNGTITHVSDVLIKGFESVPVLYIATPLVNGSGLHRVVVFEIDLRDIWQRIDLSTIGATGFTYLVNRHGLISDYPDAAYIGTAAPVEILPVLKGYEGFVEYKEPAHKDIVVAAYSPVGGATGWGIIVVQDKNEINASIVRIGIFIIGTALFLAIIGIIGILFMIRSFTRPIVDLTRITHHIAETGDLTRTGLQIKPDEVGQLNEAFNSMIDRLEKSEGRIAQAAAEERNRLARDLHDAVSQTLFSASLIAEVLPRVWEKNEAEGKRRLEELRQLTRGALAEMRTLLLELRPSALREAEFGHLLHQLGESISGRTRIPVNVLVDGECAAEPEVKVAFYRIAQEALNNVAKHSGANKSEVKLVCSQENIHLTIADDGRGFDVAKNLQKSLGLGIIKERAREIGADVKIESRPGRGTLVTVDWQKS